MSAQWQTFLEALQLEPIATSDRAVNLAVSLRMVRSLMFAVPRFLPGPGERIRHNGSPIRIAMP